MKSLREKRIKISNANQERKERRADGEENVSSDEEYEYSNTEDGLSEERDPEEEYYVDFSHTVNEIGRIYNLNFFNCLSNINSYQLNKGEEIQFHPVADSNFGQFGYVVD